MPGTVTFYRIVDDSLNWQVVGAARLQDGKVVVEPEDLKPIIEGPVWDPAAQDYVRAEQDPQKFLSLLHTQYRGSRFRAGKLEDAGADNA